MQIFFPYNIDFRGRVYPIPPNLNHVGSDLCRGLLSFSKSKPLGERGFHWLQIHLANLFGNTKISYPERKAWVTDNIHKIREVNDNPLDGTQWWLTADEPWQALAVIRELVSAIDSGDPHTFSSSLPIHQDGSCNGLQHYAALGRDLEGGTAVNLCPTELPQDVYLGVCDKVIQRIDEMVNSPPPSLDDEKATNSYNAAVLLHGKVGRKTIKQTVMTSVYGVTAIGARMQGERAKRASFEEDEITSPTLNHLTKHYITLLLSLPPAPLKMHLASLGAVERRIIDTFKDDNYDVEAMESEIYAASFFLSNLTMDVINGLFPGAREIMNWLIDCR